MALSNDSVRNKLIKITNQGLMLKAIALNIGVESRNKQNEEKPKRKRSTVSIDLLNELES